MESSILPEKKYLSLINLAPDVFFSLNTNGELRSLSSSFERITGWKRKDWIGVSFSKLIYKKDLPLARDLFKQVLSGKNVKSCEVKIMSRDGNVLVGDFTLMPEKTNGHIVGIVGISRDITKWKERSNLYKHYANLVESSDGPIYSRDLNGNIITWNKASEKLFGYKAKDIIGKNVSALLPREIKNEVQELNRRIKNGRSVEDLELVLIKKNKSRIPIIAKISPIKDKKKRIVGAVVFARDNTERAREEKAEKLLAKATKVLSSSFEYEKTLKTLVKLLIPDWADWGAVHVVGKEGKAVRIAVAHRDPKKVKWAENLEKKYGTKDRNSGVAQVIESGHAGIWPEITEELLRSIPDEKQRKLAIRLHLKSIMIVPLVASKRALGAITFVSSDESRKYRKKDLKVAEELGRRAGQAIENARLYYEAEKELKKRKRIGRALRQSRDELEIILKNVADGITVQDARGQLVYANDAAAQVSGYSSREEMIRNPSKSLSTFECETENGEQVDFANLPGRRALKGEIDPQMIMSYINKDTKERRWAQIKARPIRDEDGRIKAVVNIINDITERKELERKKDDFISIASHELKTPVTSIKGYLHLLMSYAEKHNDPTLSHIQKIDNQLNKLTELIHDLLDLSRLQSGKLLYSMEEFSISNLIQEVVDDLQKTTNHHAIEVKNGVKRKVMADKDRISQVLINFLTNAIKYSPDRKHIKVLLEDKGEVVQVSVQDFGIGIHEDEKEKIFDRFYRVNDKSDKTFPGLGIGLYISREIIMRHEGKIWVESTKGKGSVFKFTLPVAHKTI